MIEDFKIWYHNHREYQKNWKMKTHGKVVGYFCTYVPEEILYAYPILPVRIIRSGASSEVSNPHIPDFFCFQCRSLLAEILTGSYNHLDGIVAAQSCLHLRQAYMSSEIHKSFSFSHYLCMPSSVQNRWALDFLVKEYEILIKKLEKFTSLTITDSDLENSIRLMNEIRRCLKNVFYMRKPRPPLLTGTDFMYICGSKFCVDAKKWLEKALKCEKLFKNVRYHNPKRVMLIGQEVNDLNLVNIVEKHQAVVVAEESCNSIRYFFTEVEENSKDPLKAIAKRYLSKIPCPCKDWPNRTRTKEILKLINEFYVEGVLFVHLKKCHPHGVDFPFIKKELEKRRISSYVLNYNPELPTDEVEESVKEFLNNL